MILGKYVELMNIWMNPFIVEAGLVVRRNVLPMRESVREGFSLRS